MAVSSLETVVPLLVALSVIDLGYPHRTLDAERQGIGLQVAHVPTQLDREHAAIDQTRSTAVATEECPDALSGRACPRGERMTVISWPLSQIRAFDGLWVARQCRPDESEQSV